MISTNTKDLESERRFLFYIGIKALITYGKHVLILSSGKEELSSTKRKMAFWDLPGGKIEVGEQVEDALRREVSEELGVSKNDLKIGELFDVSVSNFKVSHGQHIPLILVTYICKLNNPGRNFVLSNEHSRYEWVDCKTAARRLAVKFNKSFVRKLQQYDIKALHS